MGTSSFTKRLIQGRTEICLFCRCSVIANRKSFSRQSSMNDSDDSLQTENGWRTLQTSREDMRCTSSRSHQLGANFRFRPPEDTSPVGVATERNCFTLPTTK